MVQPKILPVAVTMGDPAGIGPDIILMAYARRRELSLPPFCVIGAMSCFAERAAALNLAAPAPATDPAQSLAGFPRELPLQDIPLATSVIPGRPESANAPAVIAAIEQGVAAVHAGKCAALVTAPIAKQTLYAAGFKHPGHTEFLADLAQRHWGGRVKSVMMLAGEGLRVVPVTVHVPIADVPGLLSTDLIVETGTITAQALSADFGIAQPRIAVAGLNPHAGEGGTIGSEDAATIAPAVQALRKAGIVASGPHSADTLFHEAARATYDAVLAMYHDQALIPLKTLAFDTGVNVTLGLPFVRTSPDHGTAFDVAGTGKASIRSFVEALRLARTLADRRAAAAAP